MIYLDNAATTKVDDALKQIIERYMFYDYGNAGSTHEFGNVAEMAVNIARKQIADAINTECDNIIFTSGGSEANTLAIVGLSNYLNSKKLRHIITTKYEHHSVLNAMKEMERRGFDVTYLDVRNGFVSYDDIVKAMREDTGLVSVMYVNNELGNVNDIRKIYSICKKTGVLFHSDCVQALGTQVIDMGNMADMVSISGHKIHAPKGVGCLCAKHKAFLSNIIFGGEQEFGLRPGTQNVPCIAALGEAVKNTYSNLDSIKDKIYTTAAYFYDKLCEACEAEGISVSLNSYSKYSKVLSVRFDGVDAQTLMMLLNKNQIMLSVGSACSSHITMPSHVLTSVGLTPEQASSTMRVSFSKYNTLPECEEAVRCIVECVSLLLSMGK